MFPEKNIVSAILLILPALTLSATEILLEPSGGRAILVDSNMVMKRSSITSEDTDTSDVSEFEETSTENADNKKVPRTQL